MIQPSSSHGEDGEAQPLLSSREPHEVNRCSISSCPLRFIFIPSKAIFILLAWTLAVSELYSLIHVMVAVFISGYVSSMGQDHLINALSFPLGLVYAVLAVIGIFYPLSGFLADVYCGRFKIILFSLTLILSSFIVVVLTFAVWFSLNGIHMQFVMLKESISIPLYVTGFGAAFFIVIGYAAYQANFIQLGLDQLLEAPSTKLSVFVHWAIWADTLGVALVGISVAVMSCRLLSDKIKYLFSIVPLFILLCVLFLLILVCWKRHWFYIETDLRNPYKTVCKVIDFVRKHDRPLHRSAFTYSDIDTPSRMDFAKERYGGPFTTEQVEDVKTFCRILILLASLGPIFVVDILSSPIGFIAFGLHIGYSDDFIHQCTIWTLLESGALRYVVGSIFIPLYMYFQFSFLQRSIVSRMFSRLCFGIILWILGIFSMLAIDLAGHLHSVNDRGTGSHCMFTYTSNNNTHALMYPVLEMHWAVLIPPNILLGIGQPIVIATIFEFISAQSPHTMKGLLIGVFFAIRGVFQLISSIILFPFSSDSIWKEGLMHTNPPITNCCFGYLLFTLVTALIGLILFSAVAKRYKYRERDDRPYDYTMVEDIFERRNRMRSPSPNYEDI